MTDVSVTPPIGNISQQVWPTLVKEVSLRTKAEEILTSFFHTSVLEHKHLGEVLTDLLSLKLSTQAVPTMMLRKALSEPFENDKILNQSTMDMIAYYVRDPACHYLSTPLLFYKGYQAVQAHRAAHFHWKNARHSLAQFLHSRISEVFGVDIHPGATIGEGLLMDHATGIVIGETAVIGDYVMMYHNVLLGWNGKDIGKRHPTIQDNVLLSSGSSIIGNVTVHSNAKIAAAAVVLEDIPSYVTVAGIPAKIVSRSTPASWQDSVKQCLSNEQSQNKHQEIKILHDELLKKHILQL